MDNNKREFGQYFTKGNPFNHKLFRKWIDTVKENGIDTLLEPFAGANNIPSLMKECGYDFKWKCYDIEPPEKNNTPEFTVEKRNTLKDFPDGYGAVITNPPYLAKNSATRRGMKYKWEYDDLYKVCVSVMLDKCDYIAAIIPESFITSGMFMDRLYGVISLEFKMFDDTECPVCLALFTPEGSNKKTPVFSNEEYLGTMEELKEMGFCESDWCVKWVFNDKNGSIGVKTVDGISKNNLCKFMRGDMINQSKIKVSSRSYTRVSGLPNNINIDDFVEKCNNVLTEYRDRTKDVLMTSFKGMRNDGKYRRRLDFGTVRKIMDKTIYEFYYKKQFENLNKPLW